jgi:hypothetical protein
MGLVYPADDTWFTAPYDHGLVGRIKAHGVKDTQPRLEAHNVRLVQEAGAGSNDGFVFAGRFSRCEGTIEQKMAVISLPGKPVIYVERLQARKDVTVEEIATASMGILNEDAKPITPNRRQVWVDGGRYWMRGAAAEPAKLHVWQTSYANVDDKLSVAAVGSGRMSYQEDHRYTQARLQQVLAANYLADVGLRHNGELISEAVVEILPNVHHNQPRTLRTVKIGADGFDVQAGDWRVLINLGETPLEVGQAPGDELPALSAKVRRASR